MLRTGTSKNGRVYRYYTCSNCATKGKTVCRGRSIPMEKLDRLVTENLMERLFKPERMSALLASLAARRAEKAESLSGRLIALQRQITEAEDKLARLYRLVEDGLTDLDEVLSDRLTALKADRDRAKAALERAKEFLGFSNPDRPSLDRALRPRHAREFQHRLSAISESLLASTYRQHRSPRRRSPDQGKQGCAREGDPREPKRSIVFADEY